MSYIFAGAILLDGRVPGQGGVTWKEGTHRWASKIYQYVARSNCQFPGGERQSVGEFYALQLKEDNGFLRCRWMNVSAIRGTRGWTICEWFGMPGHRQYLAVPQEPVSWMGNGNAHLAIVSGQNPALVPLQDQGQASGGVRHWVLAGLLGNPIRTFGPSPVWGCREGVGPAGTTPGTRWGAAFVQRSAGRASRHAHATTCSNNPPRGTYVYDQIREKCLLEYAPWFQEGGTRR